MSWQQNCPCRFIIRQQDLTLHGQPSENLFGLDWKCNEQSSRLRTEQKFAAAENVQHSMCNAKTRTNVLYERRFTLLGGVS